jgi:hypothetical protein
MLSAGDGRGSGLRSAGNARRARRRIGNQRTEAGFLDTAPARQSSIAADTDSTGRAQDTDRLGTDRDTHTWAPVAEVAAALVRHIEVRTAAEEEVSEQPEGQPSG